MTNDKKTVPRYMAGRTRFDDNHIIVGVEPQALCGASNFYEAVVIPETTGPLELDKPCSECAEEWKDIREYVNPEPTAQCTECESIVCAGHARMVEPDIGEFAVEVCKKCYVRIKQSDKTSVETPYEEAEPYKEVGDDRSFTPPVQSTDTTDEARPSTVQDRTSG